MKLRSNRQTATEPAGQSRLRTSSSRQEPTEDMEDTTNHRRDTNGNHQNQEDKDWKQDKESGSSPEVTVMAPPSELLNGDDETKRDHNLSSPSWGVAKRVLHFNIFLYAACFWLQTGVLPYLTKKLGMDMAVYGYLQTFYNFIQLVGTPIYGRFGDLYGGRAALTLAYAMAASMYGLLGVATTGAFVFLSRVPALFLSANHGTQMVITDLTDDTQRAEALGRLGLSYGLGMIVGPLIGGMVTKYYSEQHAALVSCMGSLLSVLLVQLFIPVQTKKVATTKIQEEKSKSGVFSLEKYITLVTQTPGALFFLLVTMVSGLPNAIFQSMLPMILMEKFDLSAVYNGYVLSSLAIVSMLIQGLCIGPLTKRFSDMALLRASAVLLIVSFTVMAFAQNIVHLAIIMLPLTCGNSVIRIILNTVMTKIVSTTDTGTMLGLGSAGSSLVSIFAPTIGGILITQCGFFSFGVVGLVANAILLVILCRN
ncbi:solute carrier family 22 member 18-like [Patiria miniata]|uniref:Major facilitator superfamily (MFS) profile domain-containing protein n=1 Tax=Patiria miniata TaxID=46514 RepID=A0A913ZKK1_PATMI|nr:solute carrier family 22 member 18-like [Patiria miniata]XP_038051576.1 solute carrier family 22 member 18-like [Patiria miniata]XP_038051577.1 solute carrier family 22 member 18-like [Patiria miniata]